MKKLNLELFESIQVKDTLKLKGGGDGSCETCKMISPVYGPVLVNLKTGKAYNMLGKEVDWCTAFPCE